MKSIFCFGIMLCFGITLIAQNTSKNVNESQFIGTYSCIDADSVTMTIFLEKCYKKDYDTEYDDYNNSIKRTNYFGKGTMTYKNKVSYFYWTKYYSADYVEIKFSYADMPQFQINGFGYKQTKERTYNDDTYESFLISNGFLYYDQVALDSKNPNLRFKLTKIQ